MINVIIIKMALSSDCGNVGHPIDKLFSRAYLIKVRLVKS